MPITEDQVKLLRMCACCADERVFAPADVAVRSGNDDLDFEEVPICNGCTWREDWRGAKQYDLRQPQDARNAWADATMAERQAALSGHFDGYQASEEV